MICLTFSDNEAYNRYIPRGEPFTMAKETVTDEWTTVDEGSATMVSFDTIGDTLIAVKKGKSEVTDPNNGKTWNQWQFTAVQQTLDTLPEAEFTLGELLGVNGTYLLDQSLEKVPDGALTRIEYNKDVPTGKGNPMKSFKVQYK